MRNYLFALLVVLLTGVRAQDTIILKDQSKVASLVVLIDNEEIRYKLFSNISGPDRLINTTDVQAVKYKNGSVVRMDSLYTTDAAANITKAGLPNNTSPFSTVHNATDPDASKKSNRGVIGGITAYCIAVAAVFIKVQLNK